MGLHKISELHFRLLAEIAEDEFQYTIRKNHFEKSKYSISTISVKNFLKANILLFIHTFFFFLYFINIFLFIRSHFIYSHWTNKGIFCLLKFILSLIADIEYFEEFPTVAMRSLTILNFSIFTYIT